MKAWILSALIFAASAAASTQTAVPAPTTAPTTALASAPELAPATVTHAGEIGFSYSLPADWEVLDIAPSLPVVKQQANEKASSEEEKKGIACVQMALTARHGLPPSVILVVALPYACFGQTMTDKDLPGFAQGASEGLRKSFDLADPIYSAYTLGAHSMWIERAKGTVIGHAEVQYTVEMVCSTLKKGAICWMALAKDDEALKIFEHSAVILDGEAQPALVPETAFAHKP